MEEVALEGYTLSENYDWLSVRQLGGEDYSLWGSQGVLPDAVEQGTLGDCWFMAACAGLAEQPERIMSVFNADADGNVAS